MAIEFKDDNFEAEVIKSEKPVLIDFWAPWCGPCQVMGPIIEELADEVGDKVKVGKLNVDENPGVAQKFDIISIPTIKIFKDGKEIKNFVGVQAKDSLKEELEKI